MKQLVNAVQVHRLRITLSPLLHSLLNACSQVCKASRVVRTVNNDVIIIVVNMELPCCSAARIHHWEVSRAVSCCVPNNECDSSLLGIGYPASTFHGADEFIIAIAKEDDLIHHTHACIRALLLFIFAKCRQLLLSATRWTSSTRISNARHKGYRECTTKHGDINIRLL